MHEIEETGKETGKKGSMDCIPYGSSCDYQPDLLYPDVKYDLTCNGNGTITEETSNEATALCEDIADEGIVLLKNEDNILPLTNTQNINVFGWASTNPCYGGTGSGALSDAYETTTLLGGLEDAGYKINTELTDFTKHTVRTDRKLVCGRRTGHCRNRQQILTAMS